VTENKVQQSTFSLLF